MHSILRNPCLWSSLSLYVSMPLLLRVLLFTVRAHRKLPRTACLTECFCYGTFSLASPRQAIAETVTVVCDRQSGQPSGSREIPVNLTVSNAPRPFTPRRADRFAVPSRRRDHGF